MLGDPEDDFLDMNTPSSMENMVWKNMLKDSTSYKYHSRLDANRCQYSDYVRQKIFLSASIGSKEGFWQSNMKLET